MGKQNWIKQTVKDFDLPRRPHVVRNEKRNLLMKSSFRGCNQVLVLIIHMKNVKCAKNCKWHVQVVRSVQVKEMIMLIMVQVVNFSNVCKMRWNKQSIRMAMIIVPKKRILIVMVKSLVLSSCRNQNRLLDKQFEIKLKKSKIKKK